MGKNIDPQTLISTINCLSFFEENVSLLYKDLAGKVWLPLIEAQLLEISYDSQKHSTILKAIAESLPKIDREPKEYAKIVGETWCAIDKFRGEIAEETGLDEDEILKLSGQLLSLENIMRDEYQVFIEPQALLELCSALQRIYRIDVGTVRTFFSRIIEDEDRHKKTLQTIKSLLDWRRQQAIDNAPAVRFQNPDAWART